MKLLEPILRARRSTRHPHVGIDVGHRVVKAVGRTGAGVRSQSVRWDGPERNATKDEAEGDAERPGDRLAAAIREAVARFGLGSGAPAYCVVSLGLGEFRSLELPVGTEEETREMAQLEMADDGSAGDFEFATWGAPTQGDMQSVGAWRLDHEVGAMIDAACRRAGLECVGIDAVPMAMARVVGGESFESPVAVVDCGAAHPSLTIVHRGRPRYTRLLRECGADRIADSLAGGLGLSKIEADEFLAQAASPDSPFGTHECRQLVAEYAAKSAGRLVEEVQRTLEYVDRRLPTLAPTAIRLIGGTVHAYESALHERFGEQVRVVEGSGHGPTFAVAGSLLELEVQP